MKATYAGIRSKEQPEVSSYSAAEARDHLGELIGRAEYGKERITLTRHGRAAAALVPVEDLEALRALEDQIDLQDAGAALAEEGECSLGDIKADLGL